MYDDELSLGAYVEQHGLAGETLNPQQLTRLTDRTVPVAVTGRDEELYLVDEAAGEVAVLRRYDDGGESGTRLVEVYSRGEMDVPADIPDGGVAMGAGVGFNPDAAERFVRDALTDAAATDDGAFLGGGMLGDQDDERGSGDRNGYGAAVGARDRIEADDYTHPMRDG